MSGAATIGEGLTGSIDELRLSGTARDAAALLRVEYDVEAHNTDFNAAMREKFEPSKKRSTFIPPKPRGDAKAAFEAMMTMKKIDIATIEAARSGGNLPAG